MAIQMRRGANADFDKSKMLAGELAVTTDGTRKVYAAFGANDVKELASKDDVQGLIDGFTSVVDREIAEAEQRIESKAETVLGTIPDDYETVSQKADEAVRTKADAIVCTVSGVNPIAQDSSNDYLRNLKLYGKTTQVTTTGKQLFDASNYLAGLGIGTSEGGTYSDSTVFSTNYISVKNLGSIAWSGYSSEDGKVTFGAFYDANKVFISSFAIQAKTVDIPSNAYFVRITFKNECLKTLMINEGTEVLPLESFSNGYASPSPQYEQPLESKGKWGNLFNKDTRKLNTTVDNKGEFVSSNDVCSDYIEVEPNTDYYLTSVCGAYYYYTGCVFDKDKNFLRRLILNVDNLEIVSGVINTGDNAKYLIVNTKNDMVDSCMVNEGTTALPYRPYSGQKEIESGVYGKNLAPVSSLSYVTYDEKTGTINSATTSNTVVQWVKIMLFKDNTNVKTHWYGYDDSTLGLKVVEVTKDDTFNLITVGFNGNTQDSHIFLDCSSLVNGETYKVVFNVSSLSNNASVISGIMVIDKSITDYNFEPYKPKQSHISLVGDGLKGIPVTDASLATYTDENGQMICSDVKDYARSENVQKIGRKVFTGNEGFSDYINQYNAITFELSHKSNSPILCSHAIYRRGIAWANDYNLTFDTAFFEFSTLEEFTTFLKEQYANGTPVTVDYILAEPIETPLSASEIASYKALHSNYKVTTVMNDCECFEELQYNADTKCYIDNKFAELAEKLLA